MTHTGEEAAPLPVGLGWGGLVSWRAGVDGGGVAVVGEGGELSYGELDCRAGGVASVLGGLGVQPAALVGILATRSVDAVVAMLGVHRAGAAFLPLDATFPSERLKFMVEDAGIEVVLAGPGAADVAASWSVKVVGIDECPIGPAGQSWPEPPNDQLAYAIYTSGTTGRPKGVLIEHRGLKNVATQARQLFGITPGTRVLHAATFGFDAAISEIHFALGNAATLCVAPSWLAPEELLTWIARYQADVAFFVPSILKLLPASDLPRLGTVLVAGEACPPDLVRRWAPGRRFFNLYGPTETTIWATAAQCDPASTLPRPPIGKPIDGVTCYVLDDNRNPVPSGAEGELYIGGIGVGRGYHNRPDLTEQRFLPDPFHPEPGARMYRSGDLVRQLPDGDYDFLGRIDFQVKVNGYRIELEEIEDVLRRHPTVDDAAVVVRQSLPGQTQLVAYTTSAQVNPTSGTDLRKHCQQWLPAAMIPAVYVTMPAFPLSPNGKTDRNALPAPAHATTEPPQTDTEHQIANIWTQLLDRPTIGRHDDFFALGGTSLLAARAASLTAKQFGMNAVSEKETLATLVGDRTLSAVAAAVDELQQGRDTSRLRVDFEQESQLDPQVVPIGSSVQRRRHARDRIFLTGATGFLGTYLLAELVANSGAMIYCHVRAASADDALSRVRQSLCWAGVWSDDIRQRIVPVPGDLAKPHLGLTADAFDELAGTVDVIVHNGGMVNFLYPYDALRAANVEATREIIRLAARNGLPVHYVSTAGVAVYEGLLGTDRVYEDTPLDDPDRMHFGYAQTKWVSERLLLAAQDRGLPVCIYRPNEIGGHSMTGAWKTSGAFMCSLIRTFATLGTAPHPTVAIELVPVDYIARAISYLVFSERSLGKVLHMCADERTSVDIAVKALQARGYEVAQRGWNNWLQQLVASMADNPDHPFAPFVPLFVDRCPGEEVTLAEMFREDYVPEFDNTNCVDALAGSGIAFPTNFQELMDTYIDYLLHIGFLPAARP
jgi:amino acid adenylation domain-containing protein/thioester reductase-like protein